MTPRKQEYVDNKPTASGEPYEEHRHSSHEQRITWIRILDVAKETKRNKN